MKFGLCASLDQLSTLTPTQCDFAEVNVQQALVPGANDAAAAPLREQLAAAAVPVTAANCFLPGGLKCVGPSVDVAALQAWAETAFRRANAAGIAHIVFGSGAARMLPEGWPLDAAKSPFVELLRMFGDLAAPHGVTLVVEPLNAGECNFINSVADGAELVEAAGHPHIALLADTYHMAAGNEPAENLVKYGRFIRHVHVAELENRGHPGRAGEDLTPYLRALEQAGYGGAISIECGWVDFAADAPAAIAHLREQAACAGLAG